MTSELLDESWFETAARAVSGMHAPEAPDGVAQFTVSGSPAGAVSFHVVVDSGEVSVSSGRHPQPDIVMGWTYPDLLAALQGDLRLEVAYMSGRMKLEGDQVLLFDGWRPLRQSPQLERALAALR